jgi:hypothetical protein
LTAQDGQLLAEHQDLGVLDDRAHPVDPDKLQDAADQAVEERERHRAEALPPDHGRSNRRSNCWTLHVERSAFQHEDLAAAAFFGWRAQDLHGQAQVVG